MSKDVAALMKLAEEQAKVTPEEVAQVADLIDTEGEKWVPLSTGKKVKIRKILLDQLGKMTKKAGDDPFENLKLMIFHGLVEPKLSIEQINRMKPMLANEIGMAIAEYSGMTRESIKRIRNLSGLPQGSVSG